MIKKTFLSFSLLVLIVGFCFAELKKDIQKAETLLKNADITATAVRPKSLKTAANPKPYGFLPSPVSKKEARKELKICIEQARDLYKQNNLLKSQKKYEDCLRISPTDIDARISLAGILLLRKDYENSKKEFTRCLKLVPSKSALASYCHSMLGDIAMALKNTETAKNHYLKSLETGNINANSQVGLARIYELEKNWHKAFAAYRVGLIWDPGNKKAIEAAKRIKPYIMTAGEILADLKERKAVAADKVELTPSDKKLFYKISQAEQLGAIDYIKSKMKVIHPSYIMRRMTKKQSPTLHLTYRGFEVYRKLISKDAKKLFKKRGVSSKYLFIARDKKGRKVFDPRLGLLTYDGFNVYYKMLEGENPYILSSVPMQAENEENENILSMPIDERQITELKKQGFEEISSPEYIWIKEATNCSELTLVKDLDLKIVRTPRQSRYLIDALGIRKDLGTFKILVDKYRRGDFSTDTDDSKTHRAFFGTGPKSKTLKLCKKDGTLNV
jgi:Tfp pilus assembly protein PilF